MRTRIYILTLLMLSAAVSAYGQVDRKDVRKGNREFRKENYKEADIDYRKALVKDSLSLAANYNLANTLYRNGDMEQAKQVLDRIKDVAPASASAADYYFNAGDVAIARQDWQGAVEAFAKSLLINPGDLEAKENYIYAKEKLKDQQQNQQNQDQNQDQNQNDDQQNQNQNQDKDQQNKDQDKDQNQDQNDNQQDQNQDRKEQPQQGQQPKISPQAAQQMLQAIQAKEKETQDKVNRQKAEALKSRQKEKNW